MRSAQTQRWGLIGAFGSQRTFRTFFFEPRVLKGIPGQGLGSSKEFLESALTSQFAFSIHNFDIHLRETV